MRQIRQNTKAWEIAALGAALFIVLSLPWYYVSEVRNAPPASEQTATPEFVGSKACRDCHRQEYDTWSGSHHDLAMDVAGPDTVLGDFNEAEFTIHGVTSRFYRKDEKFFVYTNGPGGEMGEFEITHTFGWFPLQQYLVPFPGGRLQTLPLAWDSRQNLWFKVPPEGPTDPDDWLYWTNAAQNWNGMCAQCHSTNLKKNYDPETGTYATTWSDIDVGCEACHGPGSDHVGWAEMPEMARPADRNFRLLRNTSNIDSRELLEICAPCHSRRGAMADDGHISTELLDTYLPSLLNDGLYFADGQIHDEVYVYGSFTQSKMYHRDVRCSDCHEVHSIKLVQEGNALCLQCHQQAIFDTAEHHFHKQEGEQGEPIRSTDGEILSEVGTGASCVACHMPGRTYMGVDYRPDHSFRIPDPRLSAEIGSPDACLRCHTDQDTEWSQAQVTEWYGPGRRAHYGSVLAQARDGDPDIGPELRALALDTLYPVIVRATALRLLSAYPEEESLSVMLQSLQDEEALIRRTAVEGIVMADAVELARRISSLLDDPVKTVRIEAASRLAGDMASHLDENRKQRHREVLEEYIDTMNYTADFSASRHNLGNLYERLDRPEDAIEQYRAAVSIDDQFYPAKVNLAILLSKRGENRQAEKLLREVTASNPEVYEAAYSLGLLLVELQNYPEAVVYLENAASGMPQRGRIRYNLGLLYAFMQNNEKAEASLRSALSLEPGNLEFQYALADFFLKRGQFEKALPIVEDMASMHPENPIGGQMLEFIRRNTPR
jgi:tetratricopeptide (TPR) repeat protein